MINLYAGCVQKYYMPMNSKTGCFRRSPLLLICLRNVYTKLNNPYDLISCTYYPLVTGRLNIICDWIVCVIDIGREDDGICDLGSWMTWTQNLTQVFKINKVQCKIEPNYILNLLASRRLGALGVLYTIASSYFLSRCTFYKTN